MPARRRPCSASRSAPQRTSLTTPGRAWVRSRCRRAGPVLGGSPSLAAWAEIATCSTGRASFPTMPSLAHQRSALVSYATKVPAAGPRLARASGKRNPGVTGRDPLPTSSAWEYEHLVGTRASGPSGRPPLCRAKDGAARKRKGTGHNTICRNLIRMRVRHENLFLRSMYHHPVGLYCFR